MAKKSMNMKVKSVKRERNKNKVERTSTDEVKTFIYTSVGVLAFIGVTYLGILGMEKLGVFDEGYVAPAKGETEIDHTFINIGTVFNRWYILNLNIITHYFEIYLISMTYGILSLMSIRLLKSLYAVILPFSLYILSEVLAEEGVSKGIIASSPMELLVKYHSK